MNPMWKENLAAAIGMSVIMGVMGYVFGRAREQQRRLKLTYQPVGGHARDAGVASSEGLGSRPGGAKAGGRARDAGGASSIALTWVAPEPFGHAHCRAALASLVAAVTYVQQRLDATGYSLEKTDARALGWMLESLTPLPAAIAGDPQWGSTALKRHLQGLDAALAPGSWWWSSQRPEQGGLCGSSKRVQVPLLEAAYDAVFGEQVAKKLARKQGRTWRIGQAPGLALRSQHALARSEGDA